MYTDTAMTKNEEQRRTQDGTERGRWAAALRDLSVTTRRPGGCETDAVHSTTDSLAADGPCEE